MQCPYCGNQIAEEARCCPSCRSALVANCRYCGAELPILSRQCPACGQNLAAPPPPAAGPGAPAAALPRGPVRAQRNIVLGAILSVVTCGLWGLVMMFQFAEDFNEHRGRRELNPLLDLLLIVVTCTLWGYYVMYRYSRALAEMQREEGQPENDLALPCIILHFFQFSWIGMLLLQAELNRHWDSHGVRAA